jgi:hypothetical protein
MAIEIREAVSKGGLKTFIKFPFSLYAGNKFWVPPLIRDEVDNLLKEKNPAFEFCEAKFWLAYKDGSLVGRIAGIINHRFNEKVGKKTARFSMCDFIDDQNVSDKLFKTVEQWAKEKGAKEILGPLGFTDMDPEGMLIEGFNELATISAIYNHPYYPQHVEKLGYEKDIDWIEFELYPKPEIPEKVERIAEISLKRYKLKVFEPKKAKDFLPYAHEIFHVLNEAYKDIYGFVQLTSKQIDLYVKKYFGFIKPDYVPVILNEKNEVVAFGISMPSLSTAFQKSKGNYFRSDLFIY